VKLIFHGREEKNAKKDPNLFRVRVENLNRIGKELYVIPE
tara:strand:+ start:157 stop:276 length:120 start_codon:yes stop_codon:yes gene_type:complete